MFMYMSIDSNIDRMPQKQQQQCLSRPPCTHIRSQYAQNRRSRESNGQIDNCGTQSTQLHIYYTACVCVYIYTYIYIYTHKYMYIYIYIHICIYMYMYIHIHV